MKIAKKLPSIAFCLSVGLSTAQANFPVIDVSSIAQSILQYTQMIQEFTRYEAELRAMGIDTGRVGKILQDIDSMSDEMISGIKKANEIPSVFTQMFAEINENCEFLSKNDKFKEAREKLSKGKYKDKDEKSKAVLNCLGVLENPMDMIDIKDELRKKADEALRKKDYKAYEEAKKDLQRIKNTQEYIRSKATDQKLTQWAEFYKRFDSEQEDKNSIYNIKNIRNKVSKITESAKKATNPQEVANTTNALLEQILQLSMVQYEMSMNSNNLIIEFLSKEQEEKREKATRKNEKELVDKSEKEFSKLFENDTFSKFKDEVRYNEIGLPIMFE